VREAGGLLTTEREQLSLFSDLLSGVQEDLVSNPAPPLWNETCLGPSEATLRNRAPLVECFGG